MNFLVWHDRERVMSNLIKRLILVAEKCLDVKILQDLDIKTLPWEFNCRYIAIDCDSFSLEKISELLDRLKSWSLASKGNVFLFGAAAFKFQPLISGSQVIDNDDTLDDCLVQLKIETHHIIGNAEAPTPIFIFDASDQVNDDARLPFSKGENANVSFHIDEYYSRLRSKEIGQVLLYANVIPSTQTFLSNNLQLTYRLPNGTAFIAGHQTAGKGRGTNRWLSKPGTCLQTTFVLTELTKRLPISLLQHAIALVMVQAVKALYKGHHDNRVYIKWPNDIYAKDKEGVLQKVGGILVQSFNDVVLIGIGVNVGDNERNYSLNQLAQDMGVPIKVSVEAVAAEFFSRLEEKLDFISRNGFPFSEYYDLWLHSGQVVWVESSKLKVRIEGIDQYGYLIAKPIDSGLYGLVYPNANSRETLLLYPDGNSFDMMKNLISVKVPAE